MTELRSCCQRALLDHHSVCDARRQDPEDMPAVEVRVSAYQVCCVPRDNINSRYFTIHVKEVRPGAWIATDGFGCLTSTGEWVDDPSGLHHRHDEQTALRLARTAAPHVVVNGYTVADVLAAHSSPETTEGGPQT
ncbi:hypothetical protein ABZ897_00540 [Nonomuraea sp. NPDC046802]|uniref:hypothetical protein n=1 Tax=Nonomuraea sp. NPDC046802 TaxID=3154919 RepID=UPI0033C76D88